MAPGNSYKVEEWSRDGMRVDSLLYVGNDKAVGLAELEAEAAACQNHVSRTSSNNTQASITDPEAKLYRKGPATLLAVKIRRPVPSISVGGRFVRAIPRLKLFIDAQHILFSR